MNKAIILTKTKEDIMLHHWIRLSNPEQWITTKKTEIKDGLAR
ncbi:hypothetical protein [Paenibacillus sp. FSL R5-0473]